MHLKTFLKSDNDTLLTYFKSHKKAIANSVEQQQKIRKTTTRTQSIAGWLRNKATVHKTIRLNHTRQRKREEEKERRKEIKQRERETRKLENATAATRLRLHMIPRSTVIEKVNKKLRKTKDTIERRRRTRRRRKQSEEDT